MEWKQLDSMIDDLKWKVGAGTGLRFDTPNWKEVWETAAEIQGGFPSVRYPTKEDRQRAWARFNELRDEASRRSKAEREKRRYKSLEYRKSILRQADLAKPRSLFGLDPSDVEEMKELGRMLREAGQMLSEHKRDMLGEHKQECFESIQEVRRTQDAWWEQLRTQRRRRQEDFAQRKSDFKERVSRNLERNHERHREASDALRRYRDRADDLRDKIANAWNDSWAEGASRRLAEIEDKISDIEEHLERIEEWIREDEEKLR